MNCLKTFFIKYWLSIKFNVTTFGECIYNIIKHIYVHDVLNVLSHRSFRITLNKTVLYLVDLWRQRVIKYIVYYLISIQSPQNKKLQTSRLDY